MEPKLIRAAKVEVRSRVFDSARWNGYRPRPDDILIATYSKCGTTWMQRIVGMLVFGTAKPMNVWQLSPWPDMRLWGPIEPILAAADAQTHRRFFKTHLPYDAVPVYEGMKVIHVARDGRDAALSLHNHLSNTVEQGRANFDAISENDPKFGDKFPDIPKDPARFFHQWITDPDYAGQGDPRADFFYVENGYWAARNEPNMLLVHYADLKKDRDGEMRRIAKFLDIEISPTVWPSLVEAAGFEAMKRQGAELIPAAQGLFDKGADRFLHKGTNGRWRELYAADDLARYDAKVKSEFSPELARWIEHGRLGRTD